MWLKGFHLFFMTAWFAGLFYLPRIFVNHADITDEATSERFKMMERKLYKFITPWMILTVVFGLWMLYDYAWAVFGHMHWLHIKLALIVGLIGYHHWCGRIVKQFANDKNTRSHVWYRWFNEIPVLFLLAIIYLASIKPF
jgi:putative membrane protein